MKLSAASSHHWGKIDVLLCSRWVPLDYTHGKRGLEVSAVVSDAEWGFQTEDVDLKGVLRLLPALACCD